jgi:hypothetical protein
MLANANPDAWTRPPDGAGVKGPCVDRWVDMPVPPKVFGGHGVGVVFGGVLLFHPGWVVSSALAGLASGFGMGPGVSLSLWPP